MMDAMLADGFGLVEVRWMPAGVWEGPGGTTTLACRAATVVRWIHQNLHRDGLYVVQGNSGRSMQIAPPLLPTTGWESS